MQRIVFLLLLLSVVSCKKDSEIKSLRKDIAGTWELEHFIGYPFNQPVLPPGNGKIMVLTEDGSYERRQHDTLMFKGSYTLDRRKDCLPRSSDIIFSTSEYPPDDYRYIELLDGKLTLNTPNCYQDGGTAIYRKVE